MESPADALGEDPNRGRRRFPVMPGVELSPSGPPSTVLAPESVEALSALAAALEVSDLEARRAAIVDVVARWPRFLDGWARLGELGRDDIERYAYYRVGYHRGLDTLRANGWRGSGCVRGKNEQNGGFVRARRAV